MSRGLGDVYKRQVLDNVFTYLLLIVIIVFQADIRRGLLRMGRRMFAGGSGGESAVLERVVDACETMAARRIGALLVFEREVDLGDVIQAGAVVDARVSSELLVSLFSPAAENPLHDGAVVIRGARLTEAGALLPLSSNPAVARELGTRHRAGLGVTEETDAVAVVVSEQRGAVSVCHQGMMRTGLRGAALRREVLALLAAAPPRGRRRLPRWIARLFAPLVREVPPTAEIPVVEPAGRARRRPTDPAAATETASSEGQGRGERR